MHNHRYRRPQRRPHSNQIEGIITPRGLRPSNRVNREISSGGRSVSSMGNFRQVDGFHPNVSPTINAQQTTPGHLIHRNIRPIPSDLDLSGKRSRWRSKFHKKGRSWKKLALRGSLAALLIVLVGGGYMFGKAYLKARQVFKGDADGAAALQDNVDPSLLRGEGDGRINILLLGKGGEGHKAPNLTDSVTVASIDPIHKEAGLLSVPRDLYVRAEQYGNMKINSVYGTAKQAALSGRAPADQAEKAGIKATQKTLEQTLGIPLHYYVMVDFEAFRKAIDTVGGVTIDIKEALYDPSVAWENNNNPLIAAKGLQTFNGKRALLYARSRQSSPRGDFDRAERQRQIILALKDKVFSAGTYSNPVKVTQLIDAFGNHVQTDLSIGEVMQIYSIAKNISAAQVASIGLADPPNNFVKTANVGGLSVVIPQAGVGNFKEIQSYIRNRLKDAFIRRENASVVVLNGTSTAGQATAKADELKSYGYNVTKVADAPTKNYQQTILVDLRGNSKKYTRHYLEKRLGVSSTSKLPDGIAADNADFVIILGQNGFH